MLTFPFPSPETLRQINHTERVETLEQRASGLVEDLGEGTVRPDGSHYDEDRTGPVWRWLADRIVPFARMPVQPDEGAPATAGAAGATEGASATDPPA